MGDRGKSHNKYPANSNVMHIDVNVQSFLKKMVGACKLALINLKPKKISNGKISANF